MTILNDKKPAGKKVIYTAPAIPNAKAATMARMTMRIISIPILSARQLPGIKSSKGSFQEIIGCHPAFITVGIIFEHTIVIETYF